jgi:hypothetical protein
VNLRKIDCGGNVVVDCYQEIIKAPEHISHLYLVIMNSETSSGVLANDKIRDGILSLRMLIGGCGLWRPVFVSYGVVAEKCQRNISSAVYMVIEVI